MKSRTNTTCKWTLHFVYTAQFTAAWATGTRARSFWSHTEGFSVLQCTEQCRQARKWHISQMQSRAEGLTFWVSPTFLMHSVQLLYYNGFLHQKILQNMIELKIQQGCRTHPRSLHHFLRKWYHKKGTIRCWIRSSLQLPLLWNSQAEHMS